LVIASFGRKWV